MKQSFITIFIHKLLYVQPFNATGSKNDETVRNTALFPITNPTGVAICLFGKWLLTLCVSCALQKSKINGAHASPCCIANWLESDQTSESLGAFSLTLNAAHRFILINETHSSLIFLSSSLNWKTYLKMYLNYIQYCH